METFEQHANCVLGFIESIKNVCDVRKIHDGVASVETMTRLFKARCQQHQSILNQFTSTNTNSSTARSMERSMDSAAEYVPENDGHSHSGREPSHMAGASNL